MCNKTLNAAPLALSLTEGTVKASTLVINCHFQKCMHKIHK